MKPRIDAFALMWLALCFLVPALLFAVAPRAHITPSTFPILGILIYSATRLSRISVRPEPELIAMTFWLFVYIFMGLAPLLQIAIGVFPWASEPEDISLLKGAGIAIVGLVSFDVGHHLAKRIDERRHPWTMLSRPLNAKTVVIVAAFAMMLSFFLLISHTGLQGLLFSRAYLRTYVAGMTDSSQEFVAVINLATTPVIVLSVAAIVIRRQKADQVLSMGYIWPAITFLLVAATLFLNNPLSTARYKFGTVVVAYWLIQRWRPSSSRWTIAAIVGGFIFVFPFADLYRIAEDATLGDTLQSENLFEIVVGKGDFDAFLQIANVADMVAEQGFRYGEQLLGSALFWVPRDLWPGKPLPTGVLVGDFMSYPIVNLSAPLWAEFYIDGSIPLVIAGFLLYGWLTARVDARYAYNLKSPTPTLLTILVPVYAGYQFFMLRGSLMPALAYFAPMPIVAFLCTLNIFSRRSGASQSSRRYGTVDAIESIQRR